MLQNYAQTADSLPSTEQLLIAGGDQRLELDPVSGLNKYGCSPFPDPELMAFGSSTATAISTAGFAVADRLRQTLQTAIGTEPPATVYARHMQRIRQEWLQLCGLSECPGLELIFSPSGTDAHAVAAQYTASGASAAPLIVMVEANETGSGVASALNENPVTGHNGVDVAQVPIRFDDGAPRPSNAIDADAAALVEAAVASDRRVLLILVDQSKTGLIAPSPACAIALHRRYPDHVEVLVDACQFRIAIPTLHAYLEQNFMVALTGSKFIAAPSFSAALLLPSAVAQRLQQRPFPNGLLPDSSQANWPPNWLGAQQLDDAANFGLLLRCEAALAELRRFRAVPESAVAELLQAFATAVQQRLTADPHLELLETPPLNRLPLITADSWDRLPTIFPFLLYRPGRIPLTREQSRHIYQQLQSRSDSAIPTQRYQLGQPVACGTRNGIPVSALRLCLSSRLIIEAIDRNDRGNSLIENALNALDQAARLAQAS